MLTEAFLLINNINFYSKRWLKPHSRSFLISHFFPEVSWLHSYNFLGQFTHGWILPLLQCQCIKTTSQWFVMLFSFFSWSMSGGTEPKLEPMLDFNTSAKTTESSKPHIFLFISRWFDISFKGRSTKST